MCFPANGEAIDVLYTSQTVKYHPSNQRAFQPVPSGEAIALAGAGNDTLSFQLVLNEVKKIGSAFHFKIEDFEGPSPFGQHNVQLLTLETCQQSDPPDCLLPLAPGSRFQLTPSTKSRMAQVVWVDVLIPKQTLPGKYQGRLTLHDDDDLVYSIKITVTVYPFTLPQEPSLTVDLNNYGLGFLKEAGVKADSAAGRRLAMDFYLFSREHRMLFNPLPYKSQRGRPHPGMAPVLSGAGEEIHVKDWRPYDAFYGPLFSGSLFDNKRPVSHQYLPFNPEWPSDFSNYQNDREKYETEWRVIAEAFMTHFKEKGWEQTVFQIFLNQKPRKNNRIPWNLDEPKGEKDYKALRYYADLTHGVFQRSPRFKFRMDISHFYCEKHRGHPDKDFKANRGETILSPVDIWVISKHSMDDALPRQKAKALKVQGKSIFEYMAGTRMPLIDEPLRKAMHYGWRAWLRNEDGLVFWSTIKKNAVVSDGRDFLVYPQNKNGVLGPVASLRLKAIRRGIQDFEYFRLVSDQTRLRELIKRYLSDNSLDHEQLRRLTATMIMNSIEMNKRRSL